MVSQEAITVENPANANVVTFQVGTTVRRTDKQRDHGLLLAMVDTVTLNRATAEAVTGTIVRGLGAETADHRGHQSRPRTSRCPLRAWPIGSRSAPRRSLPYFDPIAQKPFDANYDGEGTSTA